MGDDTSKADIAVLQTEMRDVKDDVREMRGDIKKVLEFTQQARGSWVTLMAVAGAASAIGAAVAKVIPYLPFKG